MIRPYDKFLKFKYIFAFLLVSIYLQAYSLPSAIAAESSKKLVFFVTDRVSYSQLEQGITPNFNNLRKVSSEGLLNVRSEAMFIPKNPESAYLTIGSGIRRDAPNELGKLIKEGEGVRLSQEVISNLRESGKPFGTLGQIAKENGLKIGVLSSSKPDKPFMGPFLMAMDEDGKVPLSQMSYNLIQPKTNFPDGYMTDNQAFLKAFQGLYQKTDILIIDYSDTERAYSSASLQQRAIKAGDEFLGELLKTIDDQTMLVVLSPNVSVTSLNKLNYALTPIIIHKPGQSKAYSLITNNTRRPGLTLSIDILPTVYQYFNIKLSSDILGEPMYNIHKTKALDGNYRDNYLTNLSKARLLVHLLFIVLLVWLVIFYRYKKFGMFGYVPLLLYACLAYPLSALMIGGIVTYEWYKTDAVLILLLSLSLAQGVIWLTKDKSSVVGLFILSFLTSIIIISEAFFWPEILMGTPFGFNDVFIGGRFYGLNNDIMGLILGSSALAVFALAELRKLSNKKLLFIGYLYFIILVILFSPLVGVDVGGSITALIMLFFLIALIFNYQLNVWKIALLIIFTLAIQVGMASIEHILNPAASHAGKAVVAIAKDGPIKIIEILKSKLSQVAIFIVSPPWNFVAAIQVYFLYKLQRSKNNELAKIKLDYLYVYKGGLLTAFGAFIGFAFNDTGVVTAALMLLYITIPIIILLRENQDEIS